MRTALLWCLWTTRGARAASQKLAARMLCCALNCAPVSCLAAPLPIVEEAVDALRSRGPSLPTQQQIRAADAMLKAADAYGGVVSLERSNFATALGSSAPSRGVVLVKDSNVRGVLTVTALEPTSPLFAAGLRVGDRVVAFDGRPIDDAASARAVADSVRAASVLRVERGGAKFEVDAAKFELDAASTPAVAVARAPAATAVDIDGVIVLRIASFTDGVRDESARAIRAVAAGRTSVPYVVDVRSNPGGFADEAAATFGLFPAAATVGGDVSEASGRRGRSEAAQPAATPFATAIGPNGVVAAKYVASGPPAELAVPAPTALAVLVDEETRSAAELFAAAVRAQGGTVVGQKTFGKRSAQVLVPLRAAPNYAVRLTTARTVDATGTDVDGVGVAPDLAAGTTSSALDELLLRRGAFFDFATFFDRLNPGLDDGEVESVLSRGGARLWQSFVRSWSGGVDDDALPDYPPTVQQAAARAARKQLTQELVADATSRRVLPPYAIDAVLARRGAMPSRAATAGDDEALWLALDVVRPRETLSATRLAKLDASRAAASDHSRPAKKSPLVLGFDPDAACLPLQTCDARRYVYVVEP